jgi:hypothetical protein
VYNKISDEIAQGHYQQHFPNNRLSFVGRYVRNIHGQDANQTRFCITEEADDKQIDAIVIDDDAHAVCAVQSKERRDALVLDAKAFEFRWEADLPS